MVLVDRLRSGIGLAFALSLAIAGCAETQSGSAQKSNRLDINVGEDPFGQKYLDTVNSLPFPVQAQIQDLSSRFYDTIKRLYHEEGLSQREIAFKLGVSRRTVNFHLNCKNSRLERL